MPDAIPPRIAPMVRYSTRLARRICDFMAGGFSLASICRMEGMPHESQVYRWLRREPEFMPMYLEARAALLEHWEREIQEIADECPPDPDHINKARLRIDSRKWLLSKLRPKKYGDRVEVAGDPGAPLEIRLVRYATESVDPKVLPAQGVERAGTGLPPHRPLLASPSRKG